MDTKKNTQSSFVSLGSKEQWLITIVEDAMRELYRLTGAEDLQSAILYGKVMAESEREKEVSYMLALFLREEMSGNLIPPPSLKKMYHEIMLEAPTLATQAV